MHQKINHITTSLPHGWVISDGTLGMELQARGLADALEYPYSIKPIIPHPLLRLAPSIGKFFGVPFGHHRSEKLETPFPLFSITCGRRNAGAAIVLKRISRGKVFTIHIQDPRINARFFDLLVIPEHDPTRAENVITTIGSLNQITPSLLDQEALKLKSKIKFLPKPRVAVNIGGNTRNSRIGDDQALRTFLALNKFIDSNKCGLMVTTSRRTSSNVLTALAPLANRSDTLVWTGQGMNPYLGFLGLADAIIVTSDSVNMISEACTTGKPVYILNLGTNSRRRAKFLHSIIESGRARTFNGKLETWEYTRLCETKRVAQTIVKKLNALVNQN